MNKILWTASLAALTLGLASVCQATPATPDNATSAAALYNLGNSYARQAKPALAVLNYERARVLAPRDPDIAANLQHVRDSAGLVPESVSLGDHFRWLSPNTAYWIGVAGLLAAGAGWLLLSLRLSYRITARALLGAGLLLMAFTINDALAIERLKHRAVVLQSAAASAAPIAGAEPLFTVPQATVVQQQDEHAGFDLIRDPQGRIGWVAHSQLLHILT